MIIYCTTEFVISHKWQWHKISINSDNQRLSDSVHWIYSDMLKKDKKKDNASSTV